MHLREAEVHELDAIYSIGFDAWSDGLSYEKYLSACRSSKKYQAGTWYVLIENEQILSSLIVYHNLFDLKDGCFGIGSLATPKIFRGKGYASNLVNLVKADLFAKQNCKAIFLHSDIDHQFYSRLGFIAIEGSNCMYAPSGSFGFDGSIPSYF
ncbi:GNAT family N-acetyltransferase [Vibrio parahaemolyticus]|uniref:GNAT family N-acetyltransferase n=1 Tax=Vibrio parahaemolyticus TaxID=670 RepID=UPI00064B6ACD|nr:GNAT family N-acetyltransferase [Vibrio parahaemolyticus]EGQ9318398.1 GNAT family N-acetyltransferase [Vibrio parahaemolyticus]EJG1475229.1 GNAT family N-acetyltransferase [Vibrio parahaemolyticus]EKA7408062.1 GNAT family N-acetyltransferase [Vibrio parahaemolyticus]EKG9660745.1 GNAT family N-acetyltransferase [Vibrio parahaemolyticus]EKL9850702.1 GNAT family N-acetyltransferase [Vibrio parahaemolyticus]